MVDCNEILMPKTLEQALDYRKKYQAMPLAGGTDAVVQNKSWSGLPVDFKRPVMFLSYLQELREIKITESVISIGAMVTLAELANHNNLPKVLREVASQMASPAIRNKGTIGGNLCNASPAGDLFPYLYAVDASVTIQSSNRKVTMPIAEFIVGPRKIQLADDEILTEIMIPNREWSCEYYRKVGTRKTETLSKLSFLGLLDLEGDRIKDIRITFGAVAPVVVRSKSLEKLLIGKSILEIQTIIPSILEGYSHLIKPIDDQRSTAKYRKATALKLLEYFCVGNYRLQKQVLFVPSKY